MGLIIRLYDHDHPTLDGSSGARLFRAFHALQIVHPGFRALLR